jgi:hypothetical protein
MEYREDIAKRIGVQPRSLAILNKYIPPVAVYFDEVYMIVDDKLTQFKYPRPYIDEAKLLFRTLLENEV